jgi:hypothetical protein
MKKVAAVSLVVLLMSPYALGGTVGIEPASGTELYPDSIMGDTVGLFNVTLNADATISEFSALGLVAGVDGGPDVGFTLEPDFLAAFTFVVVDVPGPGVYGSDIFVDGFGLSALALPRLIGVLSVDATGADLGDYSIIVDSGFDAGRSAIGDPTGNSDTLLGSATFTVIPEPATLTLLGLAALGFLRRRKTV